MANASNAPCSQYSTSRTPRPLLLLLLFLLRLLRLLLLLLLLLPPPLLLLLLLLLLLKLMLLLGLFGRNGRVPVHGRSSRGPSK